MIVFLIAAVAIAALVTLAMARPLLGGRGQAAPRAAHDLQVFRDQLASLDRDVERGVLTEGEAAGARAEISRRLIAAADEADRVEGAAPGPRRAGQALSAALVLLVAGGGAGAYVALGTPGAPD
ncbi:MAG: c-type cytochrome biogenesis protein CcmI, partial [Pseudomonadota bacterium]